MILDDRLILLDIVKIVALGIIDRDHALKTANIGVY